LERAVAVVGGAFKEGDSASGDVCAGSVEGVTSADVDGTLVEGVESRVNRCVALL
jgi:hypothetical protein